MDLQQILDIYKKEIIEEWAKRLKTEVSSQYNKRPLEELLYTTRLAYEANYQVLVNNNYGELNNFISFITKMRLEAGFKLSDVQKAFELYRKILAPLIIRRVDNDQIGHAIEKLNSLLAYTIHRFSDYFQQMHEKAILDYNKELERKLWLKTVEMRESELRYMTLVEEINEGYFVIRNGVIVFANQAFSHMHGYQPAEVMGKPFWTFVSPESRDEVIKIYEDSKAGKRVPTTFEYMRLNKDGNTFPTEITAKIRRNGKEIENIGICRDITWRVELQKRIWEAEQMAYVAQVATSLSHELRNPLSAIKLNLQVLEKNKSLKGNDKRRVEIAVSELVRLENILGELLEFSKPLDIKLERCDINAVIGTCIELLEPKLSERNTIAILETDRNLPFIKGDPEKLMQVFVNLIANSIEAVGKDGFIMISSSYKGEPEEKVVEITIEDNGPGIDPSALNDIFKPFFTTKSKGTGLGLSIAKKIVDAHGGKIRAQNRYPKGAMFIVHLPVSE